MITFKLITSKNGNHMNRTFLRSALLLTTLLGLQLGARSPYTILPCSIEFPKTVKKVPQVCIYQGGERFTAEIDKEGKRACFILPVDKACTHFSLLITEGLQFESEENTIQYLKVDTKKPYKFYNMELVKAPRKRYRVPIEKQEKKKEKDRWIVTQDELGQDGRIPDDTIIVLLNADYVHEVRGDESFELPTIFIKKNVLNIAGSEKKLHDKSIELLLSSLDYNPLHANSKTHTRQDREKIIVAMAVM